MRKNYSYTQKSPSISKRITFFIVLLVAFVLSSNNVYAQTCVVNVNDGNLQYCVNDTNMLLGVGGGGTAASYKWSQISGPSIIFVDATVIPAQITGAVAGSYEFMLSGTCPDGSASGTQNVKVTVYDVTTANAGSDIAACPGSYALNANSPGINETGSWSFIGTNSAGAVITDPSSPTSTVTFPNASSGVSTVVWTIENTNINPAPDTGTTSCNSSDTVTLTNYGGEVVVNAGPDRTLSECFTSTTGTTLSGSSGGTGLGAQSSIWTLVSGPSSPSQLPSANQSIGVTGLIEGSYVFKYSVSGPCATGDDTVTIIVPKATQDISTATVVTPLSFCSGVTETVLTGSQPLYTGETVEWVQTSGPFITGVTAYNVPFATTPTASITGLNGSSNYTFQYKIKGGTVNPSCESAPATVNVRYYLNTPTLSLNNGNDVVVLPEDETEGSVEVTTVSGGNAYKIEQIGGPTLATAPNLYITGATFHFEDLVEAGTYTFNVTRYTTGEVGTACNTASDFINIVVSLKPSGANAGTSLIYPCGNTSGQLFGNVPTEGTGSWSEISGPATATIDSPTNNQTFISNLSVPGDYIFRWSITGGPAGTDTFQDVTITITTAPNSNAGPDYLRSVSNSICPATFITEANPLLPGETGLWTVALAEYESTSVALLGSDLPIIVNPSNPITEISNLKADANYQFTWTVSTDGSSGCPDSADTITVQTNSLLAPSIAKAGADQCVANSGVVNLAAEVPAVGVGSWTYVSGPTVPSELPSSTANQSLTSLASGDYEFLWTTSNGPCQTYSDAVKVTVLGVASVANAGADQLNLCFADATAIAVNMNGNLPTAGTGTWIQKAGNGGWTAVSSTYTNALNDPKVTFTNLTPGKYEFEWNVAQGSCDTATDSMKFSVYYDPATPIAGTDRSICFVPGTTVVNLSATALSSGSTGTWSVVSGPNTPTFVNVNSETSRVNNLKTGVYTFRWTSSRAGGVCPPKFDDVDYTVTEAADAGPDQQFCNTSTFLLTGNAGTVGTWTQTNGPVATISNGSFNTANVAIPAATTASYTFQYEITSPTAIGGCNISDTVIITNDALPTAPNAGTDQILCTNAINGSRSVQMIGATDYTQSGNTGTGTWRLKSGPTTPPLIGSNVYNETFTGLKKGLYIFEWVASNGKCDDLRDVVRVELFDPPSTASIITTNNTVLCQLSSELQAVTPTNGIGTWSFVSYSGSQTYNPGDLKIDSPNNPTTTLTALNPYLLAIGEYTFKWTVAVAGNNFTSPDLCAPSEATITISYDGAPPAQPNAGTDQFICNLNPAASTATILNATGINPSEIGKWTVSTKPASSPLVTISNPGSTSTNVSNLKAGDYEFKWTVTNKGGGCILEDFVKVTVTNAVANANAGPDQNLSQFTPINLAANNPVPGNGVWSFVSGPSTPNILDVTDPITQVSGTVPGTYEFMWTVQNSPCASTSDNVRITILASVDLSLNKTLVSPALPVTVGNTLTFQVAVTNNNSTYSATGINVLDELPIGYAIVAGSISNSGNYNAGGNTINWSGLTVAAGSTTNLTYKVTVNAATGAANEYKNTAEIASFDQFDPDSTPGNKVVGEDDLSSITIVPQPKVDIVLTKTANKTAPQVGSSIIFSIAVKNNGPSNATGVVVNDILPSGYTYVSSSAAVGSINDTDPTGTGVVWNIGNVTKDDTVIMTITATVRASGTYTNSATVTSSETDSNTSNNQSSVTPTPVAIANLSLTKIISTTPVPTYRVGSTVTFNVTVSNAGPSAATGVNVVDYLPSGYTYVSHTSTGTTYSNTNGSWALGTINSGASRVLSIVARINATGDYRNVAEVVHSDQLDTNSTPGNNNSAEDDQAQAIVTPVQVADLSLLKTVDVATPRVGDTVKFTIALNNAGPSDATPVVVNDLLPSGYSFVSYTSTSGLYNSGTGDWTLSGSVLNGKTEYLDIVAKVNPITGAADEFKNNAQVTASGQIDPDSTPNDGTGDDFGTITTTPTALIDLSLTKSVDNVAPLVGTNVVFTVTVANAGPSTATGVEVKDLLPSGYTYVSSTVSAGAYNSTTGLWAFPSVIKGGSSVLTVTAKVNATGVYKNVAEVTKANETDIDSTPNNTILAEDDQDEIATSQVPLVDLSLNKIILVSATPNVGANVTFRITVSNAGPSAATGVVVTDKLPSGYSFVSATPSVGTYNAVSGSWTIGSIANAGNVTLDIVATVLPTGNYNNIAEVTGANEVDSNSTPGNNDATENDQMEVIVTPVQVADLSVTKAVDVATPVVGSNVVFTIDVTNAGPSAATGVVLKDVLASGYEFISASPTAGMYNKTTGLWTVSRPIVANTTETIQITAKVLATGIYVNNVQVSAADQTDPDSIPNDNVGDDFATVTTTPSALVNLALVKRINNATPDVGSQVVFTIEVTNNGPSTATTVVATDRLPTGYTYVSDTGAGAYTAATGNWAIGSLSNGATATINITATVNPTGNYTNSATVTSAETDGNLVDNTNSISSTPRAVADLHLAKTVVNASPNVGENAVFNLVVTNDGPSAATGVVVTDMLPSGYSYVSSVPSTGTTYTSASGAWVVGNLGIGTTATLTITAKVLATGIYTNIAEVTGANQYDPNSIPGNNNPAENDQAQAIVTPVNVADLVTVKSIAPVTVAGISASSPNEGDVVKYNITVTNNNGPTNATGVHLTDIIPAGVTYVSHTTTAGTIYNYASGVWTIGNLNVNSTATLAITVKVNAGTKGNTIINTTNAASGDQTDPTTAGDDLTESITVSLPPVANDDSNTGNITNTNSAPINILMNDRLSDGSLATTANTIVDLNPNTPVAENSIIIPNEGTWTYNTATGELVFDPQDGFTANPTPLVYKLTETLTGLSDTATVTVTYVAQNPTAYPDIKSANPKGAVTLDDPLAANGNAADMDPDGTLKPATVSLVTPVGATGVVTDSNGDVTSLTVPNEGTWSVNLVTGAITFTPLATFTKDPTPIQYNVEDNDGNVSNDATVTIDYVPVATNDANTTPGVIGSPITINVTTNDTNGDTVNPATVELVATSVPGGVQVSPTEVNVPSVGTWIAGPTGTVTFTPAAGYTIDPPVISYTIKDDEGNASAPATITLDYAPITTPDLSTNNPINTPVVINVTGNDATGDIVDPTTVSLVNPGNATGIVTDSNGDITSLTIPGEGTWNVNLTTGSVTFTPNPSFITNPTPINYNVEDNEGNQSNNSLITIQMIPQADLVVTKTNGKSIYTPGTNSVYTIVVKNNGPAVATNIIVQDDITDPVLQAVTTWSAIGTGTAIPPNANGTGDINATNATISTMAVGETVTYTVTIAIPSNYTGKIINTGSATSDVQDPDTSNNAQTDEDDRNSFAEIEIIKTVVTATPHNAGDTVEFLVTAINNGPSDATGIKAVDKLPSGYTFVSATASNGTYNSSNGLWTLGGLTNTAQATLTVFAKINSSGNYTNSAEVTAVDQPDPNGIVHGNNTPSEIDQSDVTLVPVSAVDLVTTKTVDKSNPNQGDIIKYTLTVVNNGPSIATGVSLVDNLPVGTTYVSHVATGGTVNTYTSGQWTIGNINIGSSATLVIEAKVTAAGTITQTPIVNTTTAASGNENDPTTVGDDLTEPIVVTSADLVTEKTVSKSNPGEGEVITYTIKVTNNGPSTATTVKLTDILPIGVTYVSNNQGTDYNYGSGIWAVGDLANGETKVLNIDVIINSGSAGKIIVNRTTAAKGDQSDPTTVGDDLEETITVQNGADVVLTKVVNNKTPNIGETVTYTVTVTNKGTTLVTNLVVKDDLPAGLTFVSATPGKGVWTTPNWTVGTLQPGEEGSIEIKAIVDLNQGGNVLTNTVSNTQDQFDTNTTIDDPAETITVTSLDLAVVKTVNNAMPNEGEVINYTIVITNNGASNATNVSLIDNLPVGVTYVSNSTSIGVYNNGSGLWTVGNLANGAIATLTINATVNSGTYGTTITNTTSAVKADQSDSNLTNNIGSVSVVPTAFIDLRLTKEVVANVTNPAVGETITFEVRVINDGPTKATGVQVVDLIPSGYKFVTYSSTIGTYTPATGLWNIGNVEVNNTAVLLVDVKVLDSGNYTNCAEITKANELDIDSTPGNGNVAEDDYACASAAPNQSVDLAIVKTILKNNVNPNVNSEISFEILLTNNGNIDANDVVVSDLLPSGYTFLNYSSTKGVYDYVTGDWKVNKILNGETEILIVDVIVKESGDYLNCATIKSLRQVDTNPANNTSCIAAVPISIIDLELTKVVDVLKPVTETNVEFTVTLTNKGPSKGTGVQVKDLLPTGFIFVNAATTTGTYDAVSGIWNVGSIGINAVQTLKVEAYVLAVGEFTNVAEVIAANELDLDSTPGNNKLQEDDQDAVTVEPEILLVISEGFTPNGDGINDVFEIENLQVLYPNFSMEIVNRYGNIVYKYKHNGDKFTTPKWWNGYSEGRWNIGDQVLPAATYFYTIYFNDNDRKPQTGWIYLKK